MARPKEKELEQMHDQRPQELELKMITSSGEEHGLIKEVANSVHDTGLGRFAEKDRPKIESLRAEERRLVRARYINYRGQHERLDIPGYMRWPGDMIQTYHFIPGQEYIVPMGLVKQVNTNPGLPRRSEVLDVNGVPTKKDGAPERIHEFVNVRDIA